METWKRGREKKRKVVASMKMLCSSTDHISTYVLIPFLLSINLDQHILMKASPKRTEAVNQLALRTEPLKALIQHILNTLPFPPPSPRPPQASCWSDKLEAEERERRERREPGGRE